MPAFFTQYSISTTAVPVIANTACSRIEVFANKRAGGTNLLASAPGSSLNSEWQDGEQIPFSPAYGGKQFQALEVVGYVAASAGTVTVIQRESTEAHQ